MVTEVTLLYDILLNSYLRHLFLFFPVNRSSGNSDYTTIFFISCNASLPLSIADNISNTLSDQPAIRKTSSRVISNGVYPYPLKSNKYNLASGQIFLYFLHRSFICTSLLLFHNWQSVNIIILSICASRSIKSLMIR